MHGRSEVNISAARWLPTIAASLGASKVEYKTLQVWLLSPRYFLLWNASYFFYIIKTSMKGRQIKTDMKSSLPGIGYISLGKNSDRLEAGRKWCRTLEIVTHLRMWLREWIKVSTQLQFDTIIFHVDSCLEN